jgi:hypothetical protein
VFENNYLFQGTEMFNFAHYRNIHFSMLLLLGRAGNRANGPEALKYNQGLNAMTREWCVESGRFYSFVPVQVLHKAGHEEFFFKSLTQGKVK